MDPSLEFEKRRNIPIKYNRELWNQTVEAIKKIQVVKQNREDLHIKNRLRKGKQLRKRQDLTNLHKNINLIKSPAASLKVKQEEDEDMKVGERDSDMEDLMEAN